jgi:hypothetical protein
VKPHGFHREAREEYAQAAQDYADVSPELGGRFYDEIERLIAEVCQWPEAYRCIRPPVRRHFSTVFPYGILYEGPIRRGQVVHLPHPSRVSAAASRRRPSTCYRLFCDRKNC